MVAQFKPDHFRQLVEVNIMGAFNILAEAARQIQDGGAIVALTTSMVRHVVPGGGPYTASKAADKARQRSAAMNPFNRIGTPAEAAEVVHVLVSDKASWVHGQVVQPNGGMV